MIAISGSISRLQLPLKALRLSPANLGEVDYASALQLVEVARTKYSGKLPSSPHSVVAITYYSIAYLWEICEGLENLIPSLNLKIYCSNREVKISEDCSNTFISSMRFDEIKTLFHQSESERYPFTILKIVMNTGRSYTVCCDGGMIPFLGELVKVKIVSLQ